MRLIDADALKAKIEAADVNGTIANYCRRVMADCLDSDAPTVEAIPMAWFDWILDYLDKKGLIHLADGMTITPVLWNESKDIWDAEREERMKEQEENSDA